MSKANGAAVIVIGHRPSTLAAVDKILILIDGRVKAFGPRQQILARITREGAAANVPAISEASTATERERFPSSSRPATGGKARVES